jgi:hypothetical protein
LQENERNLRRERRYLGSKARKWGCPNCEKLYLFFTKFRFAVVKVLNREVRAALFWTPNFHRGDTETQRSQRKGVLYGNDFTEFYRFLPVTGILDVMLTAKTPRCGGGSNIGE